MSRQIFDAALASFLEKPRPFSGGADMHTASVTGIARDFNQAVTPESGDDAAHGGWLDLLGGGELAQRSGPGKDQNREGGELRRTYAGGCVLLAHAAQQVDGSGMKAVGGRHSFRPGRDIFGLDFLHRI